MRLINRLNIIQTGKQRVTPETFKKASLLSTEVFTTKAYGGNDPLQDLYALEVKLRTEFYVDKKTRVTSIEDANRMIVSELYSEFISEINTAILLCRNGDGRDAIDVLRGILASIFNPDVKL